MRSFIFSLLALFVAAAAVAAPPASNVPTIGGDGYVAETGVNIGSGTSFVGVVVFWESDDSAAYTGPTGATLDTGDEACAVYGMACADTYIVDPAGGSGDELTDSTCSTDQTDNVLSLSFCY